MKYLIIIPITVFILWAAVSYVGIKMLNDEVNGIESKLGKKILFDNDSVIIIDYNIWHNTYILSNGKQVSFKLIK